MSRTVQILQEDYKIVYYLNENVQSFPDQEIIIKRAFANFNNLVIEDFIEMIDESLEESSV